MGDSQRFSIFAKFIASTIPKHYRIADVASGGGYLQQELRKLGFNNVTSWDTRHEKDRIRNQTYVRKLFDYRKVSPKHYDAIIGLHPDGATDHIVMWASIYKKLCVVCPCCNIPSAVPFRDTPSNWINHLKNLAKRNNRSVTETTLNNLHGKNVVLIIL